jgi:hypothetical protein
MCPAHGVLYFSTSERSGQPDRRGEAGRTHYEMSVAGRRTRNSTQVWGLGTPGVADTVRKGPAVGTGEGTYRGVSSSTAASQASSAPTLFTAGVPAWWMRRT